MLAQTKDRQPSYSVQVTYQVRKNAIFSAAEKGPDGASLRVAWHVQRRHVVYQGRQKVFWQSRASSASDHVE